MERENRLPDVIFLSSEASELLSSQTTEAGACIDSDGNGINVKDASLSDVSFDDAAEYRNIAQLWHPSEEKPHCAGALLCWCEDDKFFVHEHFCHDDFLWELFIKKYHLTRYCYIANLMPVPLI